jgi:hypothetical protein
MATRFGFKKLTLDNWMEPDTPSTVWTRIEPDGTTHPMEGNDWVRTILKPELSETVPDDVQALFEVARGALAYGYFFYPLYTLGVEQLCRVAEAAVTHKCRTMGAPKSATRSFKEKVDYLINQQVIPEQERIRWNGIRGMRNEASHPEQPSIIAPPTTLGMLQVIAERINAMFKDA